LKKLLVTGGAGFIGSHLIKKLIDKHKIICVDNFNKYYDPKLKKDRIKNLLKNKNFKLCKINIADFKGLKEIFEKEKIDILVHLAAQAGVRYSLVNPFVYEKTNVLGTVNLLELSKDYKIKKFIFASSSSVYGNNKKAPFSEDNKLDNPASLYGATKIAGEAVCKSYYSLYKIPICALRFFTVYGPWGRPDMAYFKFTKALFEDKPIDVYNFGRLSRDFTYIDDIIDGILKAINYNFDFEIINLGNNKPINLLYFIKVIEEAAGKKAKKKMMGMQKGDVKRTWADIGKAKKLLGWQATTDIKKGIDRFVKWYKKYHEKNINN